MHQMIGKTYQWLGREPLEIEVPLLEGHRVLVTGAHGFIGQKLCFRAGSYQVGAHVYLSDIDDGNVLNTSLLSKRFQEAQPTIVIHLAAHKYATSAEEMPAQVAELNIVGTNNVVEEAAKYDAKVVLASTCKAVEPCTAYGASKLIAERVVLNYWNGVVFRLVNVIESTGSVVDIWNNTSGSLPITSGIRYWISPDEAVNYLLACADLDSGVYAPAPDLIRKEPVAAIARRYAPSRKTVAVPLRRGDRPVERLVGKYDKIEQFMNSMIKIKGPWDESRLA